MLWLVKMNKNQEQVSSQDWEYPNFTNPTFCTYGNYSLDFFFPGVFSQGEQVSAYFFLFFRPGLCLAGNPQPKRGLAMRKKNENNEQAGQMQKSVAVTIF